MCLRRCQVRDRWRTARIFTARLGDGTTVAVGGGEAISRDEIDAHERDPDALRYAAEDRAAAEKS